MRRLDDKVALVTGGASGIGRGIATRLAAEGASVFISDVQCDLGREVAAGEGFGFLEHDVSNEEQWTEVVQNIEQSAGRLNILINNAGIVGSTNNNPESTQLSEWRKVLSINLDGVFLGCRAAIAAMRKAGGGAIVNIASGAAHRATSSILPYGASKAAVWQLTKSVADYCAKQKLNIRCNSVHPGFVPTPMQLDGLADIAKMRGISNDDAFAAAKSMIPMGDFGAAEDIAAAVAFLASEDARYITGAKLLVDGGAIME